MPILHNVLRKYDIFLSGVFVVKISIFQQVKIRQKQKNSTQHPSISTNATQNQLKQLIISQLVRTEKVTIDGSETN